MGLKGTLSEFGFDPYSRAKMVRHKDTRPGINFDDLVKSERFEEYQCWEGHPRFHDTDFIVSFVGDGGGRARFWGVYRVLGNRLVLFDDLPQNVPWPWREEKPYHLYELERVLEFDTLKDRLVIEWSGRNRVQELKDNANLECPLVFDVEDPMWSAREGGVSEALYLRKKRNRTIVEKRKQHDNHTCKACGFVLEVDGKYIIDCHHLNPFDNADERITSIDELVCLCPTCHRIAHVQQPPLTPKEIQQLRRIAL